MFALFRHNLCYVHSIDATNVVARLGRYANDAPEEDANCVARFISLRGTDDMAALFAKRNISKGEELLYSYSNISVHMPWRSGEYANPVMIVHVMYS